MLNDDRLLFVDIVTYGIMWDASRDFVSRISQDQLAKRLRKSEDTARRSIRRLAAADWIKIIDHGPRRCREYLLLTPSTRARISDAHNPRIGARDTDQIPCADAPESSHQFNKNPRIGAAQPKDYLNTYSTPQSYEDQGEQLTDSDRARNIERLKAMATAFCRQRRAPEGG